MRATDLARLLAGRVESVATHLLPNGKREGHEWRVGSINGEPGRSMGVHLSGEKSGVWLDGETGQCGDLIGLWMVVRGVELRTACAEAMEFLGIQEDRVVSPQKTYSRPSRDGVSGLSTNHRAWLQDERKLSPETLVAYRIASRGDRVMFPFLWNDELVFAKYRRIPKEFSADKDCEPILFGWQAISPNARSVVIAEGELDAMAFHTYGYPALSVPTGAGGNNWIDGEFDKLAVFDTIYLSMDEDKAGQKALPELCERLGRERVRVVRLPRKDCNECLIDGIPTEEIATALRDARTQDPSELKTAVEFEDAVIEEFHRKDSGMVLPWRKAEGLLLRDGEVSIWAGINGHGKSEVVGNIVAHMVTRGAKAVVASLEFKAERWLKRMYRQIAGIPVPTDAFLRHISGKMRDRLWVFNVAGTAKANRIIEVLYYAHKRYAIDLVCIDNLAKCGFDEDDFSGQKQFVDRLTDFARDTGCHVMLVHHMRKGESEDHPAGKMGIKGSGGITDMADTIVEVWRNKPREAARRKGEEAARLTGEKFAWPEKFANQCDTLLSCHKQRNGECEPKVGLYFDGPSHQFLEKEHYYARAMIGFSLTEAA